MKKIVKYIFTIIQQKKKIVEIAGPDIKELVPGEFDTHEKEEISQVEELKIIFLN